MSIYSKFCAFVRVQRRASEIFEKQKLQSPAESQLCCYQSFVISVIYIWSVASFRISADSTFLFLRIFRLGAFVNLKISATADNSPIQVSFYRDRYCFWSIDLESPSLAAVLRGVFVQAASHQDIFLGSHFTCFSCFVLPALLCCNVIFIVICFAFH